MGLINKDDVKVIASPPDVAKGDEETDDEFDIVP